MSRFYYWITGSNFNHWIFCLFPEHITLYLPMRGLRFHCFTLHWPLPCAESAGLGRHPCTPLNRKSLLGARAQTASKWKWDRYLVYQISLASSVLSLMHLHKHITLAQFFVQTLLHMTSFCRWSDVPDLFDFTKYGGLLLVRFVLYWVEYCWNKQNTCTALIKSWNKWFMA